MKKNTERGATLMEIVVVIGIAGVLLGMGLPMTWDFYLTSELRAERANAVQYLRVARTRALSNRGESAHGVALVGANFVVFEGANYAGRNVMRDQAFPRSFGITATGTMEFVFAALSGRSASASTTFMTVSGSTTVRVNTEGLVQ
ncbi:MAG: type II secretion system protein [bacterium]|nr:type II secretion system protein [bacterium]